MNGTNALSDPDDEKLQAMRLVGDAPADNVIKRFLARESGGADTPRESLTKLANNLVGFDEAPQLPELLKLLKQATRPATELSEDAALALAIQDEALALDDQEEALAEYLFTDHGLKILMILVFYSLPAAYAAFRGVHVLHSDRGGTGFLVEDVNRRLIETTQFVLEVLTAIKPTGSDKPRPGTPPHERALASARRVRLLHAVVRAMILSHTARVWDVKELGTPVNQEDMAGTFLTFSFVVIDGMRKLRLRVSPEQERVYYDIWRQIAPTLGLDPTLIPPTIDDAEALTNRIRARQVDKPLEQGKVNDFGRKMTEALLDFLHGALPWPLNSKRLRFTRRLPASVIRFFLPNHPHDVATSLGVPRTYGLDEFVRLWFYFEAVVLRHRFFDAANRLVFKEWGRRDERAKALGHFSRFFMRRFVIHMESRDRTEHLPIKNRTKNIDLLGWNERWQFDQASFMTRGIRRVARNVRRRR